VTARSDLAVAEVESAPTAAVAPAQRPYLHWLIQVGRVVVFVAVIAAVVYAIDKEWASVHRTIDSLSWKSLVAAFIAIVLGMLATVRVWEHLLAAMGIRIPYLRAAQISCVGQLGKYLPGTVWAFVLQAQLGKRYGLYRPKALVALMLSAGVTSVAALVLAAFAAPELAGQLGPAAWLLCAGPLTLLMLYPPVLTKVANLALRILRKPQLSKPLIGKYVYRALGWALISWLLYGVQLWLLTGGVHAHIHQSPTNVVVTTGAFALGMSAGFVAFFLPSGIGVREAVIVAGLAPIAHAGTALALALTSRLLFTAADISTAIGALIGARVRHGGAPVPSGPER
jgi:Predicted integral membrane protein